MLEFRNASRVIGTLFVIAFLVLDLRAADGQSALALAIEQGPPDIDRVIAGTSPVPSFVALIKNRSSAAVTLQIIPMLDRQGGNGRFSACYLERWDRLSQTWVYLPSPVARSDLPDVRILALKPGEAVSVCSTPSPLASNAADCYRFILQIQVKRLASPTVLSAAFPVGGPTRQKGLPPECRAAK
jgi:hypothetical protein